MTTALIYALLFHFLEMQCTVFRINRSSSLESFAMYLKTQESSDILLSSSYDGVVTYPPVHPLDFSRASIGYLKAVETLIVIWLTVSEIIFVFIVSFKLTELSSDVWLFTLFCIKC